MNPRQTVFITGAASGIGLAAARFFAARGWIVGIADIDLRAAQRAVHGLGSAHAHALELDVRNAAQWEEALASFCDATGGKLDVLVNNAGIAPFGWFEAIPPEAADRAVDINIKGVINGAYAALPRLAASGSGRLVNVASCAALYGAPRCAVYSATKFAVRGLSEALDVEFSRHGVAVSCVMPWFIETPILDGNMAGTNQSFRAFITAGGHKVYTAEQAAATIWQASHGSKLHHIVGGAGRNLAIMARRLPGVIRRQLKQSTERESRPS